MPIYVHNEFGEAIIPFLTDALQDIDARVAYRSSIHPSANDNKIVAELYKLMTMQTRVFIVHMALTLGFRFFAKAKEVGMMTEGYVWIITDGITNFLSMMDHFVIDSMQGSQVMGTNKEHEQLEAGLGGVQDGLHRMELDMADKFRHLKETLNRLSNVLLSNQEPSSHGNHHREGNDRGQQVVFSKIAKLEFPLFLGNDPTEWFNRVNQFFEFQGTPKA
ncbi:hypothetical protein F0562_007530 [Nyssa sinensis]|uniref:Receptor ligand binding region domain-containing protein n=1 Tax=Nyssa sinensis TaxID=561372 RepID=A0A5J5A3K1_9ASTE|nr:hypothetical protein F0562_007530 [Nyssa sinensis]